MARRETTEQLLQMYDEGLMPDLQAEYGQAPLPVDSDAPYDPDLMWLNPAKGSVTADGKPSLRIGSMRDIEPVEVQWLWEPYIPLGKITILQGDPGMGKTFLSTRIAAIVSTGGNFPDGTGLREPGGVLMQTAEDDLEDTIVPRLIAAGADRRRINYIIEDEAGLTFDDERLREAISRLRPKLVVIDPLQAYLGGKDMNQSAEMRPLMHGLKTLAEEFGCAMLLIGHMNKAQGGKTIYRGLGSIDIAASARSVLAVGPVPDVKHQRAVVHIKSNCAAYGPTLLYNLDADRGFEWAGTSGLTADEILNGGSFAVHGAPEREDAEHFLTETLKEGKMQSRVVEDEARACGISAMTLRRARERLGVVCTKGKGADKSWYWELTNMYPMSRTF